MVRNNGKTPFGNDLKLLTEMSQEFKRSNQPGYLETVDPDIKTIAEQLINRIKTGKIKLRRDPCW